MKMDNVENTEEMEIETWGGQFFCTFWKEKKESETCKRAKRKGQTDQRTNQTNNERRKDGHLTTSGRSAGTTGAAAGAGAAGAATAAAAPARGFAAAAAAVRYRHHGTSDRHCDGRSFGSRRSVRRRDALSDCNIEHQNVFFLLFICFQNLPRY